MGAPNDWDETRATARLANLDIEVMHRRTWTGDAEQLQVTLTGVPSLELANPMLFWMRMAELAWAPWLAMLSRRRGCRCRSATDLNSDCRSVPGAG